MTRNVFISSINNSIKMSIKARPDAAVGGGWAGRGDGEVETYAGLHCDSAVSP